MQTLPLRRFVNIYLLLFAVDFIILVVAPGFLNLPHFGYSAQRVLMIANVLISSTFLYTDTQIMNVIKSNKLSVSNIPNNPSPPLVRLFVLAVFMAASAFIPALLLGIPIPMPHGPSSLWR